MNSAEFHWTAESIKPELLSAVGSIVLAWSWIDNQITDMVRTSSTGPKLPPKAFDNRIASLQAVAANLFAEEPDEFRVFRWYVQRVKTANGLRDAVCHGMPGTIKRNGRSFFGLMVPKISGGLDYVPMTFKKLTTLAEQLNGLATETAQVSIAYWEAFYAVAPDRESWSDRDGKWTRLTPANRQHRLPRSVPVPEKFI